MTEIYNIQKVGKKAGFFHFKGTVERFTSDYFLNVSVKK